MSFFDGEFLNNAIHAERSLSKDKGLEKANCKEQGDPTEAPFWESLS